MQNGVLAQHKIIGINYGTSGIDVAFKSPAGFCSGWGKILGQFQNFITRYCHFFIINANSLWFHLLVLLNVII